MKTLDVLEYTLPAHLTCALVYGDLSGLENEDIEELTAFTLGVLDEHDNALWIVKDTNQEPYYALNNDLNNLAGDVREFLIVKAT